MNEELQKVIADSTGQEKERFIEEAVRAYLFERAVEQAKASAGSLGERELNDLIEEAVDWARAS